MKKILVALAGASMVVGLSACGNGIEKQLYDCDSANSTFKQWNQKQQAYCARQALKARQHTHADGTTHIHDNAVEGHYHTPDGTVYTRSDGVFKESDNDYDRESTLNDLSEDDEDIKEWRKTNKMVIPVEEE